MPTLNTGFTDRGATTQSYVGQTPCATRQNPVLLHCLSTYRAALRPIVFYIHRLVLATQEMRTRCFFSLKQGLTASIKAQIPPALIPTWLRVTEKYWEVGRTHTTNTHNTARPDNTATPSYHSVSFNKKVGVLTSSTRFL